MSEIHSQSYTYVVGGLTPNENHEFEIHLSDCPDCTKEVAEMRDVTARLSESVATTPPPGLRASILALVAETRQDAPPLPGQRETTGARPAAANVISIRRSWASRGSALVAAAAVLGAVGFGGWALQSRNTARHEANVATSQADQLTQLLAAGDLQTASATFTDGGAGSVVRSPSESVALLVASDLPTLPDGRVYEAWTFGRNPVPAGTFSSEGGKTVFALPAAAIDTDTVAVTVEPTGGSQRPTTDPVFVVDLTDA